MFVCLKRTFLIVTEELGSSSTSSVMSDESSLEGFAEIESIFGALDIDVFAAFFRVVAVLSKLAAVLVLPLRVRRTLASSVPFLNDNGGEIDLFATT